MTSSPIAYVDPLLFTLFSEYMLNTAVELTDDDDDHCTGLPLLNGVNSRNICHCAETTRWKIVRESQIPHQMRMVG